MSKTCAPGFTGGTTDATQRPVQVTGTRTTTTRQQLGLVPDPAQLSGWRVDVVRHARTTETPVRGEGRTSDRRHRHAALNARAWAVREADRPATPGHLPAVQAVFSGDTPTIQDTSRLYGTGRAITHADNHGRMGYVLPLDTPKAATPDTLVRKAQRLTHQYATGRTHVTWEQAHAAIRGAADHMDTATYDALLDTVDQAHEDQEARMRVALTGAVVATRMVWTTAMLPVLLGWTPAAA